MSKKINAANLPEAPAELLAAIDKAQALADKIQRFEQRVTELPKTSSEADAACETARQALARKDAEYMLASDTAAVAIQREVAALEADLGEKEGAALRLTRQLPEFDVAGEELYEAFRIAQNELLVEQGIHKIAIQDVLSDRIIAATADLAEHCAVYRSFASAANVSRDWQTLAHVSDPRHACAVHTPTETYDGSPNLLELQSDASTAAVAAAQASLAPLRQVTALVKERRFIPLANRPKASPGPRGSSQGPNGVPDAPHNPRRFFGR